MNSNKGQRFAIEVLTSDEIAAIIAQASRRGSCGLRYRALIMLLYRAGLRIAEALALMPKNADLVHGVVDVLHGKGDKRRVVGLDDDTAAAIRKWSERRAKLGINGTSPLFCTLAGKPLTRIQFAQKLKELARRAGVEKRVHPHGLRHSFASKMAEERVDLRLIQLALGHADLATTARYVEHVRPQQVIDAMRGVKW